MVQQILNDLIQLKLIELKTKSHQKMLESEFEIEVSTLNSLITGELIIRMVKNCFLIVNVFNLYRSIDLYSAPLQKSVDINNLMSKHDAQKKPNYYQNSLVRFD